MIPVYRLQIDEPGHPSRVTTVTGPTEIGRDCEGILVDDATASRRHALVEPSEHGLILTDLDSSNGTIAGGEPVTEPLVLLPGAWFKIGETRIIVHEGRPDEGPQAAQTADIVVGSRVSGGRRDLQQAASHTARPGGAIRRPSRP